MVIKIFSDKSFLPPRFACHILLPFWEYAKSVGEPDADKFDKYIKEGPGIFQMAPLQDADLAVYPASPTSDPAAFKRFQNMTAPKPLIAFFNDDSDAVLDYREGTTVFRTSFYKSRQRPTEFALPGWSADCGAFAARPWNPSPTVSFCGQHVRPHDVRGASLDILDRDPRVATRFIRRNAFWGGWIDSGRKPEIGRQLRREFLGNIEGGDYVLCARGGGNFSYRLYETLMCGRIPLFIDTDSVLPYDFLVEWGRLFPVVDKADIPRIGDKLLAFHQSLSPEAFVARQGMMRALWDEWLSPVGFFSNLHKHFKGAGI